MDSIGKVSSHMILANHTHCIKYTKGYVSAQLPNGVLF